MYMFANDNEEVVIVDPLDTEAVKNSFATVSAQKKHWREKAVDPITGKTYKELLDESKQSNPPPKQDLPPVTPPEGNNPKEPDADWLFENIDAISSLTSNERTELRQTAKELNVDPIKFIKSKAGQAQLEKIRSTTKTQEATPSPSVTAPTFNGKPIRDILTDEKATPAEKQAAYEARMRGNKGANQTI